MITIIITTSNLVFNCNELYTTVFTLSGCFVQVLRTQDLQRYIKDQLTF